ATVPLRKLTETKASFITPDIRTNVTVSVQNSQSIAQGSTILIQGAGAYLVISLPSTTSITVQNLGSAGNVAPNIQINAGADIRDFSEQFPDATLRFSVLGPRFTLDPQVVNSVFPPPGSV